MKLIDLLLLFAACALVAAGWLITPPLGLLALSVALAGIWWAVGDES